MRGISMSSPSCLKRSIPAMSMSTSWLMTSGEAQASMLALTAATVSDMVESVFSGRVAAGGGVCP